MQAFYCFTIFVLITSIQTPCITWSVLVLLFNIHALFSWRLTTSITILHALFPTLSITKEEGKEKEKEKGLERLIETLGIDTRRPEVMLVV